MRLETEFFLQNSVSFSHNCKVRSRRAIEIFLPRRDGTGNRYRLFHRSTKNTRWLKSLPFFSNALLPPSVIRFKCTKSRSGDCTDTLLKLNNTSIAVTNIMSDFLHPRWRSIVSNDSRKLKIRAELPLCSTGYFPLDGVVASPSFSMIANRTIFHSTLLGPTSAHSPEKSIMAKSSLPQSSSCGS